MSDEESEEHSEEEEQEEEENQEEDDEDEEEGDEEDDDEEQGSGDQDEEESNSDQQEQKQSEQQESKPEQEQKAQELPKFRSIQPEEVKFTNLLSEISSLSVSVDRFIDTLPSHGNSGYRKYVAPPPRQEYTPRVPLILPQEPKVVVMKDEDIQVTMQPQIVIQPTRIQKPAPEPAYKISNQSNKFLAQLYQQNKKLKRWSNTSHNMNTYKGGSSMNGFYGSRQKFQRREYEKGLFDVDERNKQIDDAIEMLKRNQQ